MEIHRHMLYRGNGGKRIIREKRNYRFFVDRYARYIEPVACHETLKVSETFRVLYPSRQFFRATELAPQLIEEKLQVQITLKVCCTP